MEEFLRQDVMKVVNGYITVPMQYKKQAVFGNSRPKSVGNVPVAPYGVANMMGEAIPFASAQTTAGYQAGYAPFVAGRRRTR